MTTDSLDMRSAAACAIAREAGVLARKRFLERPRSQRPDMKGPQDFLTETDAEVEELIRRRLHLFTHPRDTRRPRLQLRNADHVLERHA